MQITLNLRDIIAAKLGKTRADLADEDIGTAIQSLNGDDEFKLDIDDELAKQQLIAIIWNTAVVHDERPDLTQAQAFQVLQGCESYFDDPADSMQSIVRQVAERYFPKPRGRQSLLNRLARLERHIEKLSWDETDNPAAYGAFTRTLDHIEQIFSPLTEELK